MISAKNLRWYTRWALPIFLSVIIYLFKCSPYWVEVGYSARLYPVISLFQRQIWGALPFSMGDVGYTCLVVWLLYKVYQICCACIRKKVAFAAFTKQLILHMTRKLLWLYVVFNLLWGLNYNRLGIAYQLHLHPQPYTVEALQNITCFLLDKANESRYNMDSNYRYPSQAALFRQAAQAYRVLAKQHAFLQYSYPSVKPSMLTNLVSSAGYSGYYNPFSGEAQLNTDLPDFLLPYTTCHEIAHQLGYASESEANFVGYLAAIASTYEVLHYSAYFDLYLTANRALSELDLEAARINSKSVIPLMKQDILAYRKYIMGKNNPYAEPLVKAMYSQYLKANNQQKGIESYDDVLEWLIAYTRK